MLPKIHVHLSPSNAYSFNSPLRIIVVSRRLERQEGSVGRVDKANGVGEELARKVEEDEEHDQGATTDGQVSLGDSGLCLELVQLRDLAELLVQLGVIVACCKSKSGKGMSGVGGMGTMEAACVIVCVPLA